MSVSDSQKHYTENSLFTNGEVLVPLVYIKKEDQNGERYLGFIPGFVMKNISSDSFDDCKTELMQYLKERLKSMIKNNVDVPFFPTEDVIRSEYDDVYMVEFVKIKK